MPIFPFSPVAADGSGDANGTIQSPQFWAGSPGWEYWLGNPHADLVAVASATNPSGLDGWGWTCTTLSVVEGGTGDFMSSADNDPTYINLADAADVLSSPRIFGGYDSFLLAEHFLGAAPTKMCVEFYAAFAVNSTNQTTTFIGMTAPATVDAAAAGSGGAIVSNGANFVLVSDTQSDAGAVVDTLYHKFRLEYTPGAPGTLQWFIDDVSQGSVNLETDIWPLSFKAIAQANDIRLCWLHIWYEA